jgi:hypothetical protein
MAVESSDRVFSVGAGFVSVAGFSLLLLHDNKKEMATIKMNVIRMIYFI